MIVWNEFRHDARVLKEAETLQAAGHSVTVHALYTPGGTRASESLPSGVRVGQVKRFVSNRAGALGLYGATAPTSGVPARRTRMHSILPSASFARHSIAHALQWEGVRRGRNS